MDILSKTLKEEAWKGDGSKLDHSNIDFEQTWRFNASEEDEKQKVKKVYAKQKALIMSSRIDRKTINDMLLKEQDVFVDTPKYLAVTQRLYRTFAEQTND